jgi:hypothetical protein
LDEAMRARKDVAVRCYASQMRVVNYLRAERGLAQHQASGLAGAIHAERYWECEAAAYFAAFRASGADRRIWY